MTDEAEILRNPEFQKLLKHRSRWRWRFYGTMRRHRRQRLSNRRLRCCTMQ